MNIFEPRDDTYIRLTYSDYLVKKEFTKILAFKRYFSFDYILTDTFLVKARNPYAVEDHPFQKNVKDDYELLAKEEEGEELVSLIFLGDPNPEKVGVGLVSFRNGKK